jgi:hypothetical protein
MKSVWSKSGNSYRLDEVSHQSQTLPVGIYRLEFNSTFNFFYLDHVQEQFEFPYKIYGVETDFINRVKKSWENTTGNMGVLLNGLKGTGKTVTAELICNTLAMPVILVQKHYEGLVSFLNSIQQDVIIFIDEYEKIYNKYDNALLSVMDGAFRTGSRKVFLLTTNDLSIEKNMLQRPSRIRYIKTYTDLTLDVIMEVVDDKLIYPSLRDKTIKMISELPIITMDLVKAVVEEVNIHNEDPAFFKDIFNVQGDQNDIYNVFILNEDGSKTEYQKNSVVHPHYFSAYEEGESLYINKRYVGVIEKFINKSQLLVSMETEDNDDTMTLARALSEGPETPQVRQQPKKVTHIFYFEPAIKTHKAFNTAAF